MLRDMRFVCCLHFTAVPVRVHAQIDSVISLVSGGISLLLSSPALAHEADIAAVMRHMPFGVVQAEGVLGGLKHMVLELAQHIGLLPECRPLVGAPLAEGLRHGLWCHNT